MGMFDTWVNAPANIRAAGVAAAYVKDVTDSDAAYYALGLLRDGKLLVTPKTKTDTFGRPYAYGQEFDATFQSFFSSLTIVQNLTAFICGKNIDTQIQTPDNLWYVTKNINSTPLYPPFNWKILITGDMNDFRVIEYHMKVMLRNEEFLFGSNKFVTNTADTLGSQVDTDIFWPILHGATLPTSYAPNGFAKLEFAAEGDSYTDFGDFREGKYTIEPVKTTGGGGRNYERVYGIKFMIDAIGNQTSGTEIGLLSDMAVNPIKARITHMDGVKLTLDSSIVQMQCTFDNSGNVDKPREIKCHIEGILPFSTTWGGMSDTWTALWS